MAANTSTLQELADLDRRLSRAEIDGDIDALDALATDDFTLVGPVGFVLDKPQWLDRYRGGGLRTKALAFEDAVTRVYADAAIRIGRHVQQAEFQGRPVDGEFRATHIAVRQSDGWRLAGVHLSPIGGPPPFARPTESQEQERWRPVISSDTLADGRFEGAAYGPTTISMILDESRPGTGPRLHRHPYDETWVVLEGDLVFEVGDRQGRARAGDIVLAPPDVPHKFTNQGAQRARLICIHANPTIVGEFLE